MAGALLNPHLEQVKVDIDPTDSTKIVVTSVWEAIWTGNGHKYRSVQTLSGITSGHTLTQAEWDTMWDAAQTDLNTQTTASAVGEDPVVLP